LKEGAEGIPGSDIPSNIQTAWNVGHGLLIDIHGKKSFLINNHLIGCQLLTKFFL